MSISGTGNRSKFYIYVISVKRVECRGAEPDADAGSTETPGAEGQMPSGLKKYSLTTVSGASKGVGSEFYVNLGQRSPKFNPSWGPDKDVPVDKTRGTFFYFEQPENQFQDRLGRKI